MAENLIAAVGMAPDSTCPLVLDTNAVLDWLVFRDARCHALERALATTPRRWHATVRMRGEFERVLRRPEFQRWVAQRASIAAHWDANAHIIEAARPALHLTCSDPDDQMFLDLATQLAPCILLTRDHALLRLRSRAARVGVQILEPAQFS